MIKPGTYKATVLTHAISETKDGLPQAAVTFSFDADGPKTLTWYGSFKEKSIKFTVKALIACGLKGNNPSGQLEIGKEVSIVINDEVGRDGKIRSRVQWVNSIGGIRNVIPQEQAKVRLATLEGAVMAARNDLGSSADSHADLAGDEEIPDWMR